MAGRILDSTGFPVSGVAVTSLEGRDITESDGHFAVEYQPPNTYVGFDIGVTHFRRTYQQADDGRVVDVSIPRLADRTVTCSADCTGRLQWKLGPGFSARATLDCTEGQQVSLAGVPALDPALTCSTGEASLRARADGQWTVGPPSRRIRVHIEGATDCRVSVGGVVAQPNDGVWEAEGSGVAAVHATCDDVPVEPVHSDAAEVRLIATQGQRYTLDAGVERVQLLGRPDGSASWLLDLSVSEGTVVTPVLRPGMYVFVQPGGEGLSLVGSTPDQEGMPGVLHTQRVGDSVSWWLRVAQ